MFFDLFKSLDEKIKRDENLLIAKLRSYDIKDLIIAMDSDELISKNVLRKRKKGSYGSGDTVSWFAYKVSGELNDPNLKSELIGLLNKESFAPYKKFVLTSLSSLCANTNDFELYDFLIQYLKETNDNTFIIPVVSRFSELKKTSDLNIDYLKDLFLNGTYDQRMAVLRALRGAEHQELEEILIKQFKVSNLQTKEMICSNLGTSGSKRSFEFLETEYKRTKSNHLRYSIECAIKEINKRQNKTTNLA